MSDQFDKSLLIEYWINSSETDFKTMEDLFHLIKINSFQRYQMELA
jgi:hypothetical protein